jgi:hypothetical protein
VLSNQVDEGYYAEAQRERARLERILAAVLCPSPPPPPGGPPPAAGGGGASAAAAAEARRRMALPLGRGQVAAVLNAWAAGRDEEEQARAAEAVQGWADTHLGGAGHSGDTLVDALLSWQLLQHEVGRLGGGGAERRRGRGQAPGERGRAGARRRRRWPRRRLPARAWRSAWPGVARPLTPAARRRQARLEAIVECFRAAEGGPSERHTGALDETQFLAFCRAASPGVTDAEARAMFLALCPAAGRPPAPGAAPAPAPRVTFSAVVAGMRSGTAERAAAPAGGAA